jgi:hypothetical protein
MEGVVAVVHVPEVSREVGSGEVTSYDRAWCRRGVRREYHFERAGAGGVAVPKYVSSCSAFARPRVAGSCPRLVRLSADVFVVCRRRVVCGGVLQRICWDSQHRVVFVRG